MIFPIGSTAADSCVGLSIVAVGIYGGASVLVGLGVLVKAVKVAVGSGVIVGVENIALRLENIRFAYGSGFAAPGPTSLMLIGK